MCLCTHTQICMYMYCSVAKLCPSLFDTIDYNPPGSSVHGIVQALAGQNAGVGCHLQVSSWFKDWTCVSCIGRGVLYHWATWGAYIYVQMYIKAEDARLLKIIEVCTWKRRRRFIRNKGNWMNLYQVLGKQELTAQWGDETILTHCSAICDRLML